MKRKSTLTAFAVAVAALVQPALAGFTQNEKGEVTHYNGIELPPIQTIKEAKAQAQKEIAAAKKAREAQQAEPATRHSLPATPPQEVFFTGKPYLEETGQYLFRFRHYDPELARWTTADPSGFPDGANNFAYMAVPTIEFDWQGLAVSAMYRITTGVLSITDDSGAKHIIQMHSGNGQHKDNYQSQHVIGAGPIPIGQYGIYTRGANLETGIPNYPGSVLPGYILDAVDANRYDDRVSVKVPETENFVIRGQFRIHEGSFSEGCIVGGYAAMNLIHTILSTSAPKPDRYDIIGNGYRWDREFHLGMLQVIE